MGIHVGPAEQRDGDYYGAAVNLAARLMSVAHGGQIVVSLATEEMAVGQLPSEVELLDLGQHSLRDLSAPSVFSRSSIPSCPGSFRAFARWTRPEEPGRRRAHSSVVRATWSRSPDSSPSARSSPWSGSEVSVRPGSRSRWRRSVRAFPDGAWFVPSPGWRRSAVRRGVASTLGRAPARATCGRACSIACAASACSSCSTTASTRRRRLRPASRKLLRARPSCGCSPPVARGWGSRGARVPVPVLTAPAARCRRRRPPPSGCGPALRRSRRRGGRTSSLDR